MQIIMRKEMIKYTHCRTKGEGGMKLFCMFGGRLGKVVDVSRLWKK